MNANTESPVATIFSMATKLESANTAGQRRAIANTARELIVLAACGIFPKRNLPAHALDAVALLIYELDSYQGKANHTASMSYRMKRIIVLIDAISRGLDTSPVSLRSLFNHAQANTTAQIIRLKEEWQRHCTHMHTATTSEPLAAYAA